MDENKNFCKRCIFVFILLVLVGTTIQMFILPRYIRKILWDGIEDATIHTEIDWDDDSFCSWQNNTGEDDSKIYFDLYLYNVTNPEEVRQGALPKLDMLGPFSYHRYGVKGYPQWSDDQNTVSYVDWVYYNFNREGTPDELGPNSKITMLNPVLFTMTWFMEIMPEYQSLGWMMMNNGLVTPDDLFLQATAEQIIFGVEVPLLVKIMDVPPLVQLLNLTSPYFHLFTNATSLEMTESLWGRNTIYTGNDDRKKVGMQQRYDYMDEIPYYAKPFKIEPAYVDYYGVDRISQDEDVLVWVVDVYRNAVFNYEKELDFNGVTVYRHRLPVSPQLDNVSLTPDNAVWYQFGPSGVVNLSSVPPGYPIFVGKPRFLDSGWSYQNAMFGLDPPDRDRDDSFLDIEPKTGGTFRAQKFLQFNFPVNTSWAWWDKIDALKNLSNTTIMYPMGAAKEHFEVTKDDCEDFVDSVYGAEKIAKYLFYAGLVSSVLLGMIVIYLLYAYLTNVSQGNVYSKHNPSINSTDFSGSTARWKTVGNTQDYTVLVDDK